MQFLKKIPEGLQVIFDFREPFKIERYTITTGCLFYQLYDSFYNFRSVHSRRRHPIGIVNHQIDLNTIFFRFFNEPGLVSFPQHRCPIFPGRAHKHRIETDS